MFTLSCAILMWTIMSISTIIFKTEAANIKTLEARDHAIVHSVNITRSHDGDIIIVKGELAIKLKLQSGFGIRWSLFS